MARQIAFGAKADVFISANKGWVAYLNNKKLLSSSILPITQNHLVFATNNTDLHFDEPYLSKDTLLHFLGKKKLALANPRTAPAGIYARTFLQKIGAWPTLQGKLAFSPNVRQTLRLVERGGLFGFVYKSDALTSSRVKILYSIPASQSEPIIYYAATTKNASHSAQTFTEYLRSPEAASIWEKHGFTKFASN